MKTNTSTKQQQQQILNVGTEVFQDSENTQIHMGTCNISQIPDIYFVKEFFYTKNLRIFGKKREKKEEVWSGPYYTVGRTWTNKHFFFCLIINLLV